ncbi:sn-glycerol-1-phosphate dehydrogenase [Athalassotoga saccharophila]|uniref:sn-glycerol-1-phosphate dehydrogenase n=1 Tax=Athalassotoga saccharophila TaxID=1441386 RepID=UPI0018D80528|nr:sn-glycerol-1-phosphate dehydrogenase [Athalassotoga saccharophila]BBJ28778.1 glycerol-1-phosphate dehydrogenase [NAD(P)+] [Athalassotoga saccharophila]
MESFEGIKIDPIRHILIDENVLKEVPYILKDLGVRENITVICDQNTYEAAGKEVIEYLKDFDVTLCKFDKAHLVPDERSIGEMILKMNHQSEFLCAVGSGTINDLTRFVSFKTKIPYGIVATAPSMDGYTSSVSPLIVNGFKRTYNAGYPQFVVGDLEVISRAPYDMITSGFGDIIGKYTSLADWMVSNIVNGEKFSEDIANIVRNSIERCVRNVEGIKSRNESVVKNVMDALVLSGIAMLKVGNSRPASGLEHHIAHYIEIKALMNGQIPPLHGSSVGVAEVIATEIYHKVFSLDRNEVQKMIAKAKFESRQEYVERIKRVYGPISNEIFEEVGEFYFDNFEREKRQKQIVEKWDYLKNWVRENVPEPYRIKELLKSIGAPMALKDINVKMNLDEIVKNAKEIRKRYTILRLAEDIGLDV